MRASLLSIVVGLLGTSLAWAQPVGRAAKPAVGPAAPSDAKASEAAIRQAGQAYGAALNAGDFKTAALYWATDGEFVDAAGRVFKARKVVGEELASRFSAADKPQLAFNVKTLRMVTSETAVEDGSLEIKAAGGQAARRGNYSALWVKRQGKWLIHSIHESVVASRTREYRLADLGWLVGHWTAQAGDETVDVDCSWAPGKSFLVRDITVQRAGKPRQTITQRIGLDPSSPKIKSWAFESSGGMAEATWEKSGNAWQVFSKGTTKGGHPTSAKNIYSEIGPEGFTVESVDAKVGSHSPPTSKLTFKRSEAAGPSTAAAPPVANNHTAADTAARERILNSPQWRETQRAADEWLSVQTSYRPAEVKQIRAEMAAKTAKMTAPELQNFLDDAQAKYAILLSKQAEEARLWLAQRMAVEVKATPEELKQLRPDIVNMSAAQVEERLMKLQVERKQIKQAQQAFDAGRKQEVTAIEQADKEEADEREAALNRAYSLDTAGGYYYGGNVPYDGGWGGSYRY